MEEMKDGLSERKDLSNAKCPEHKRDNPGQMPPGRKGDKVKMGGKTFTIK